MPAAESYTQIIRFACYSVFFFIIYFCVFVSAVAHLFGVAGVFKVLAAIYW